ncbi:uncharacterized protein LOC105662299 [Megachile rotundata]|uniref:uncharacterized protein LOC105662299 n=1 Tax=Megachile rotundata TaxID=143995 RepID=UPI003FD35E09
MLRNDFFNEIYPSYDESESDDLLEQKICVTDYCIPKLEPPCLQTSFNSNEDDILNPDELTSPIPFIVPYKIKDPIVVLERCDKIWETLQLIKNVQEKTCVNSINELSLESRSSTPYVDYHPVLSHDNAALPDFKLAVKTKKKLFQCPTCGKLYMKHVNLRQHAERVHQIFILPLRIRHPNEKDKEKKKEKEKDLEKESNVFEKEKKDLEQSCSKESENNLPDTLLQSATLSSTEQDMLTNKKLKTKSSVSIQPGNNINDHENSKKKLEKKLQNKDLRQNEKQISLHQDSTLQTCSLCKQTIKDIKKHFTDYHKIESCEFMLKELEKPSLVLQDEESNNMTVNNEPLEEDEILKKQSPIQGRQKRKSSVSPVDPKKRRKTNNSDTLHEENSQKCDTRKCDVCLGLYKRRSFHKHLRRHRVRGETKENIHLFRCKYSNSPLYFKHKEGSNVNGAPPKNTNKISSPDLSKKREAGQQMLENLIKDKDGCNTDSSDSVEKNCICGKQFRHPYSFFLHKKNCTLMDNKIPAEENNLGKSISNHKQDSCNKECNSAISITIKKKNNSYEIVGKNGEIENKLQNLSHSKKAELLDVSQDKTQVKSRNQSLDDLEASKYSKYHSILKIQTVEEDIDIDIEEESQSKSCNNNIDQMNELIKNVCIEEDDRIFCNEKSTEEVNSTQKQKVNLKSTNGKVLRPRQYNANIAHKYNICVCGSKFYNRKAFDIHISKHQTNSELTCGYCKTVFTDISTWDRHQCYVKLAKRFIDSTPGMNCYYCSTMFLSLQAFDDHMKHKHFDAKLPYQCPECHKRFTTFALRKLHFSAEHNRSICSICQKECRYDVKFRHDGYHYGLGYPCHLCKRAYSTRDRLSSHKGKQHSKPINEINDSNETLFMNSKNQSLPATDKLLHRKSLRHVNKNIELDSLNKYFYV